MRKPRVVIVSSYGNPLVVNAWLKYYAKFWHDVVDYVYIVAAGNTNNLSAKLISANHELCDAYNKKTNSNKLKFMYAHFGEGPNLTTHAHLLYNGTQQVIQDHKEATLCFMDDDMFVRNKTWLINYFEKLESDQYYYCAQIFDRKSFGYDDHLAIWFMFADLQKTKYLMDSYEPCANLHFENLKKTSYHLPQEGNSCIGFFNKTGNFFGSMRYFGGCHFGFANYTTPENDINHNHDEVGWLYSALLRRVYGVDKQLIMPREEIGHLFFHSHLAVEDQANSFIEKNYPVYHISGNYQSYTFCYQFTQEERLKLFAPLVFAGARDLKFIIFINVCLSLWDISLGIDTGDIYQSMLDTQNTIRAYDKLDPFHCTKNVEIGANIFLRDVA